MSSYPIPSCLVTSHPVLHQYLNTVCSRIDDPISRPSHPMILHSPCSSTISSTASIRARARAESRDPNIPGFMSSWFSCLCSRFALSFSIPRSRRLSLSGIRSPLPAPGRICSLPGGYHGRYLSAVAGFLFPFDVSSPISRLSFPISGLPPNLPRVPVAVTVCLHRPRWTLTPSSPGPTLVRKNGENKERDDGVSFRFPFP
jgi:hypothetical protein